MVQKALLGWAESLTSIYNIVSKKNLPRVPKKLLELSCLHQLPQMSGFQQQRFRNLWDALLVVAMPGKLQGMGWVGTVGDSPQCSKLLCTGKSYAQHPEQSEMSCRTRRLGKPVRYYSNTGPNSILYVNRKPVFCIHQSSWEGNSYVNLRQKILYLVPVFTKSCPPFRKLKSVRAVSPQYLSLYHNTPSPVCPQQFSIK